MGETTTVEDTNHRLANTNLHRCLVDPSAPMCGAEADDGDYTCTRSPHALGVRHEAAKVESCEVVGQDAPGRFYRLLAVWHDERGTSVSVPCDVEGFTILQVLAGWSGNAFGIGRYGPAYEYEVVSPEGRIVCRVEDLGEALMLAQRERVELDSGDDEYQALQTRLDAATAARSIAVAS